ncbi:MAG: UDP-N-acetylmuramoyl-L-alanine--D-glutamate ligase [Actinomycetaceae bacterium]|nr:UDP-N-acetylmuramoyl-L-alanine--D-glutamate ligase [Actinomycetaceae bacterium]
MTTPKFLQNVAVLGHGVTGRAVSSVLRELGASVTIYTTTPNTDGKPENDQTQPTQTGEESRHGETVINGQIEYVLAHLQENQYQVIITSPGISPSNPLYQAGATYAEDHGIGPLWSEMELAWHLAEHLGKDIDWYTVTGTNGKTTTVSLVGAMLTAAGIPNAVVGNVGRSIVEVIAHQDVKALAVEMSSFQLHNTYSVQPVASVCLNVDADHLDWHGTSEAYAADKARVYSNTEIACVYDALDAQIIKMVAEADVIEGARAIGYRADIPARGEIGIVENYLVDRAYGEKYWEEATAVATLEDVQTFAGKTPSPAVLSDVLAAIALVRAKELSPEAIRAGLQNFRPAPHRREIVGEAADMTWIDDSKATNAHAAMASLRGFPSGSVIWIAGGDTKGQDFSELVQKVQSQLRGVVVIGADPTPMVKALEAHAATVPYVVVDGHEDFMYSVVNEAVALSRPGDHVVLAPACASWDQFNSYAERGEVFKEAVARLKEAWAQAGTLESKDTGEPQTKES